MRIGTKLDGNRPWDAELRAQLGERAEFFLWLRENGFGFVELACSDQPCVDNILDYARACAAADLGVSLHPYTRQGSPVGFGLGPVEEVNEGLLDLAERIADIAGRPQRMVLHAGLADYSPYHVPYGEAMERAGRFFRWLEQQAESRGGAVRPFCETAMPTEAEEGFERIGDTWPGVLELVGPTGLSVCWDTGHAYLSAVYDKHKPTPPQEFLGRVGHVHLHDVAQEGGRYTDHHPPGEGIMPWRGYLRMLSARGYDGWVLLELTAALFDSRKQMLNAFRPAIQALRDTFCEVPAGPGVATSG